MTRLFCVFWNLDLDLSQAKEDMEWTNDKTVNVDRSKTDTANQEPNISEISKRKFV